MQLSTIQDSEKHIAENATQFASGDVHLAPLMDGLKSLGNALS